MTKRQHDERSGRAILRQNGWDVSKTDSTEFNSGSETVKHSVCKHLTGKYLLEIGYRLDSESTHPERGEIDVVGYGHADRTSPIAVECETSPTEEVIQDKLDRYYDGTPIQEVYVLNVSEMPTDMHEAYGWIQEQL